MKRTLVTFPTVKTHVSLSEPRDVFIHHMRAQSQPQAEVTTFSVERKPIGERYMRDGVFKDGHRLGSRR